MTGRFLVLAVVVASMFGASADQVKCNGSCSGKVIAPQKADIPAPADDGVSPLAPGSAAVWTAGPLRRVSPADFPKAHELAAIPRLDFDIARRGCASAQVLVSTAEDVEWSEATLKFSVLTDNAGRKFGGRLEWRRVGYIPCGGPARWFPDPLLPARPFKVRNGSTQSLWVSVHADAGAPAGVYFGEIEVIECGRICDKVQVSVKVRDFSLPEASALKISSTPMDDFLGRFYPGRLDEMRRRAVDVMRAYRLEPDRGVTAELAAADEEKCGAHPQTVCSRSIETRLSTGFMAYVYGMDECLRRALSGWNIESVGPFDISDTFLAGAASSDPLGRRCAGALLYPAKDGPLPSISLALLRDGVQDYEWLTMAEKKQGRKAVDAVSRRLVRSHKDFTRDPAAVRDAHGEIGDMIDGGASRRICGVPDRHLPKRIMGRDYWPALYKFGDWLPRRNWKTSTSAVRFDNPAIFELPAFRDFAPVYWARRNPPPYESGKGTWRHFADNFTDNEPDREIIDSNPSPEKPFLFAATGKRQFQTWGMEIDLDYGEFEKWKAAHPNALYDGMVSEWDNDLMMSYGRVETRITNEAHRAVVRTVIGANPRNRYERMDAMRRMYHDRKRAAYGGTMAAHTSNVLSMHLGADCGAAIVSTEMTNTSGGPANDTEYRWNIAPFFVRGAARQFGLPWEWYWAQYMNGFRHTGEWHNNAVCEYPAVKKVLPAIMNHGPEFGTSSSLMRRFYYFSYLNGANVTQPEEWSAYFLTWDDQAGKTVLTGRGRDYAGFHDFTQAHPDRGAAYTPVAVCLPLSRGYTAYGGWAWASDEFEYTKSDLMSDSVFFSLVPGFERAKAMKAGVETCLHNSKFAQMYDVVCPDVPSQSEETIVEVLKSYRAIIVAGEFDDPKAERAIGKYEREGGRVVRLPVESFPKLSRSLPAKLKSGKVSFPEVEKLLAGLERDYFPFKVEGDCLYGANRTEKGWWLWVFNNRGVTKFTDLPHTIDHAFDAEVKISGSKARVRSAKELLSGKEVEVSGDAFTCRVKAGDLAVFEIRSIRR